MGRHPRDRVKMAVSTGMGSKPAITHYELIASGKLGEGRPVSLVQCRLETGRTHQIRVHMQSIGFPLVGDTVYGKQHLADYFPRQALQARRPGPVHPARGGQCEWHVPLAPDLAQLPVAEVMTRRPRTIAPDALLANALEIQETAKITALIVVADERPVGLVHYLDLLRAGVT